MAVNIQLRRGTAAQWTAANPILALAEMAIETDTDQFKVGNGVDHWNDLPYGGVQGPKGVPGYFTGLDLIGVSSNINDRPASANNGDAWGLATGTNLTIYIWNVDTWYSAGPITSPPTYPIANTIFVAIDGDDDASGDSPAAAVLTIERAVTLATARQTLTLIEVGPGTYFTEGHIDLPDNCIIKCAHRSVIIKPDPGFEERNVFRLGSGCFVEGFIFEGWRVNDLDNPTEGFAICFRPGAVIRRAPYAHKIAVRSIPYWDTIAPPLDRKRGNPLIGRGAGVVLADGLVCDKDSIFPNIMTWGATPVSPNGVGYCAKNGAAINAVNAVAMWAHKHFYALNGGQLILSGCSTQFGDYTMVSKGYRNLVNPYESTATFVAQPTAANTITSNTSTIINTMWAALTATGYTSTWDAEDEALTKRDANTFLQVVRWVLQTGNEKPALDFARGLFDVAANKVFSNDKLNAFTFSFDNMRDQILAYLASAPEQYNTTTCKRDIGFIVDAIGMDLLYNSTSDSQFAGLQYWSQTGLTGTIPSEKTATIAAIGYLRDISLQYIDSALTATAVQLFSTITNIITTATTVSNWISYGGLPSSTGTYIASYNALQTNKSAMQDAVIAFVGSTYPTLVYNTQTCRRDVGYILDSVGFDLLHGGNVQSIKSGVYYYGYSSTSSTIGNELDITIAAYNYIKVLLPYIITGVTATNVYQTGTVQVISANTGTANDVAALSSKLTFINQILTNGPEVADPLIPLTGSITTSTATINAYNILLSNKNFIKEELIAYTKTLAPAMVTDIVYQLNRTLTSTQFQVEPSLITAIGHTWSAVMAGVALTKIPPARNQTKIQDSILELDQGNVIASGQDDQGNAIFVGGLEINADTGELTGPPFTSAVNQIAIRASITRSF